MVSATDSTYCKSAEPSSSDPEAPPADEAQEASDTSEGAAQSDRDEAKTKKKSPRTNEQEATSEEIEKIWNILDDMEDE